MGRLSDKIFGVWESMISNTTKVSIILLGTAILLFFTISYIAKTPADEFIKGIHIELFGTICDIIIMSILYNYFVTHGEKRIRAQYLIEKINDYKNWKSDESKIIIRSAIRKLNELGVSKIVLANVDISDNVSFCVDITNGKLFRTDMSSIYMRNSKFNNTYITESDFQRCTLVESEFINSYILASNFSGANLQHANFNQAKIINSNFSNTNLQCVNFSNEFIGKRYKKIGPRDYDPPILKDVDFRDAIIMEANFNYTRIENSNFEGAKVEWDFISRVSLWNIFPRNIFLDYKVVHKLIDECDEYHLLSNNNGIV